MDQSPSDNEELLELASKLQMAVEASRMGVWEFDEQSGRVHWDDRMLEIYGISDGLNHRPDDFWESHIHPEDLEQTRAYADQCTANGAHFKRDYRIVREDGDVRHIRSLARSVAAPAGMIKLIGVNIDVTEDYQRAEALEMAQRQLKHEARHDALTGLGNRRRLDEMTLALFNRLTEADRYCVMHLDLDHFKQVNDTLGHLAGDYVLKTLANTLVRVVGGLGTSFRVGGDEFAVLFEDAPFEDTIVSLCDVLIEEFAAPLTYAGEDCSVGVSIGYAFGQGQPRNPSDVFVNADAALYAAKYAGRSSYRAYSADVSAQLECVTSSRQDLLKAIKTGQLTCVYQPQFDARTLDIVGAEALVRWNCPDKGLLTPDAFLPQAERVGLVAAIDACVFQIVTDQQNQWVQDGVDFPTIAVNTSAERLRRDDLVETIRAALKPHHKISLELLETAFLDTIDADLATKLHTLRGLGVRIELDDFGSGHSSVAALQAIRPDQVKIDRSLVQPLTQRPDQVLTLQSLARIARLEGADVAIEGLESGLQLAAIRDVDCDVLQGYTLERPMQAEAFAAFLTRAQAADDRKVAAR